ncbi:hypothetical protein PsYK624_062060 [Phanerochaete sordida]|uniref:Uncharacterized protein n=1 Tax=Phanerochaete sordida TaxID=48140 RepID=A0A9P3G865_9APHY|nr:hypothetical protein PsYK624_062060 [Phanerochaete sordida]
MFTDALEELKTLLEGDKFLINWGNARHRDEKDTERLVFRGICDPALYVIRAIIHKGFNEPIVDTCTHPYLSSAKQKKVIPDAIVVHKGQSPRHRIPAAVEIKCHTVIKHDLKSHAWKAPIADALTSQEDDEGGDGEGENEGVGDDDDGDDNDDGQDVELTANVSATIFEKFFPKPGSDILSGKAMYFNWPQSKENLQKEIKIICQLWMQAVTEDPDLPQDVEQGWPRCPGRVILSTFASTMFFVRGTGENDDTFYYSSILNSAVDPVLLYAVAFFADAMGILKKSSLNLGKADTSWWSEKAFEVQIPKGSKPWSGVCPNHLPMYIEAEMLRRDRRRSV